MQVVGERRNPQLKFLKNQVKYVISGNKTLEPRPRSIRWINIFEKAEMVDLTFGPRFRMPVVFATAKLTKVEIRPFETVTRDDLRQISRGWEEKDPKEFMEVHNKWYANELAKGYPVAWIYFEIVKRFIAEDDL